EDDWKAPNIFEDAATKFPKQGATLPVHDGWFFYLQRICNHCSYPGCLAACPRNAIYKRPEDGIVLVDQERCRGYRKCVEACPYKKAMYRPTTRTSEKCIGCFPRLEGLEPLTEGLPTETRCMTSCVGKIRMQGLVDVGADGQWLHEPNNPLYYLVHEEQVALPMYPQFGTQPNVYYIPPRWVPRDYLHQMFGPGVEQAIDRYTNPSRELLALLQLFRAAQAVIFRFDIEQGPKVNEITVNGRTQEIFNDTAVGFGADGNEIVRISVQEPFFERPGKQNSI
ncbi:MAG TPA: 4Fe-4S dicluster domain-containing protein, partial [Dehalococcoidia bacterium]|nr:4Fe-4S dicluster domain-containing protein [Dehalococcoidia bacterium]